MLVESSLTASCTPYRERTKGELNSLYSLHGTLYPLLVQLLNIQMEQDEGVLEKGPDPKPTETNSLGTASDTFCGVQSQAVTTQNNEKIRRATSATPNYLAGWRLYLAGTAYIFSSAPERS